MSDRERGPYTSSADDPILTFDAREEDDNRRGPFILIAAVGFLILFTGVIWNFYRQGVREGGREGPPRIAADASPYKSTPAASGGLQAPDQDKAVYGAVTTASAAPVRVETVDRPEEPMIDSARAATPAAAPAASPARPKPVIVAQNEAARPPTDLRPRIIEPAANQAPAPAQNTTPAPAPRVVASAAAPPKPAPAVAKAPSPKPVAVASAAKPAPKPTPAAAPAASGGGSFSVQLGAFGSRELAEGAWKRYAASGGFGGRSPSYQSVERDGKTLTRLRTGGFASRADAQAFCAKATAAGAACIVAAS